MRITKQHKYILGLVCDTFIPSIEKEQDTSGYWKRKGTDIGIVEHIIETIQSLPEESRTSFVDLLDLLDSRKLGLTWMGPMKSFGDLSLKQREEMLQSWSGSIVPILRGGFTSLKKVVGFSYFAHVREGESENPNWKSLGYPGILKGQTNEILETRGLGNNELEAGVSFEVIVIGSGAGGGVVASELAQRGFQVAVLEKGDYVPEQRMSSKESEMIQRVYDRKGAFTSVDGGVSILAGSCVGGGTTVNWSASFRTPDYILREWAEEHDNPQFLDADYLKCFDFIEQKANINTDLSVHNPQNQYLIDGAKNLGYHHDVIPRNVAPPKQGMDMDRYWKSQGYGGLGDSFGYKQGTMKTFLQDAVDAGAKVYSNIRVERILHRNGEANGVEIVNLRTQEKFQIKCKKVVLSAGALHSPAILKKSGLQHQHIGKHLYLHPTNAISGIYEEPVEGWYGPMMSAVSDEFTQLDGNFGYKLETPPLHTGFGAMSLTWKNGEQFKQDMLNLKNTGTFIVLTRDKFGGRVEVDKNGRTLVHYKLNPYDRKHLVHGMVEGAKIHKAAGAAKVRLLHNDYHLYEKGKDNFEIFTKKIEKMSWAANRFILYSAHQMGTCRMGGRDADHPVKPNGETREISNLFVADASVFPRCSGVNPMLSIQALAYYISKQIK